jgi:hypothetical protein
MPVRENAAKSGPFGAREITDFFNMPTIPVLPNPRRTEHLQRSPDLGFWLLAPEHAPDVHPSIRDVANVERPLDVAEMAVHELRGSSAVALR